LSKGSYLIGTDVGTLGTKTVLVDLDGKILSTSFEEYGVSTSKPLWAEQWPDVWFNAVCKTIRFVVEGSHVDPKDVAGLCISGLYGGSGIPLRQRDEATSPMLDLDGQESR